MSKHTRDHSKPIKKEMMWRVYREQDLPWNQTLGMFKDEETARTFMENHPGSKMKQTLVTSVPMKKKDDN